MASTYSNLKIQLMTTGENSGTWGNVTNTNLGTALEEAIVGSADVTFSSGTVTLTLTDTNSSQIARNLRLNLTGTSGGAQNLIVPAIEKVYLVNNGCADAITVKNSTGTGIAVPAGKTMWVYNNGTNVVDAVTHLTSLTLASALPVASGGTGTTTSTGTGPVVLGGAPSISNATLITPILGTPQSGTLTNCTGLPVATGISGLGTNVATFLATPSSANLAAAVTNETGSGALVFATSPTLVTPALGTPSSGTLTNCTGYPVSSLSGTVAATQGGTGQTSYAVGDLLYASTTTALSKLADVATGNALISGGVGVAPSWGKIGLTTHVSGTLPVANGGTGVTTSTGSGNVVLSTSPSLTSPTLTTPVLGTPSSGTLTSCTGLPLTTGVTGTLPVANGGTGVTTSTGTGSVVLSASPTLSGTPLAPTASVGTDSTQIATTAFVRDIIPTGIISLWYGSIASIPSGWYLCDGNNGTPDLRDRFVVGAGSTYAVATTGGSADAIVVSHSHTATSVVTDPGHTHSYTAPSLAPNNAAGSVPDYITTTSATSGSNTTGITVATTVASSGSSGTNANLPPYYALAYIMKA